MMKIFTRLLFWLGFPALARQESILQATLASLAGDGGFGNGSRPNLPFATFSLSPFCLFGMKNFTRICLLLSIFFLANDSMQAQSSANYAFTTNTTGSLALDINSNTVDMSTGTTQLVAGSSDQGVPASVANIGFTFFLMGNQYTQFSASANGVMQLGATIVSGSTYVASGGTTASPKLSALAGDLQTGSSGKVHYKLVGTAPNRCLVVEFLNMNLYYVSLVYGNDATYQVRLYETTGVIEYVYGTVAVSNIGSGSDVSPSIGFSTNTTANNLIAVDIATNTATTTSPFTENPNSVVGPIANLTSASNGSRRVYRFTPTAPANPTTLTFTAVAGTTTTPNWVDNSTTETSFFVTRATDAGFTTNVVTGTVASTTTAGTGAAYSLAQTGLNFGTTYYYKIQAVSEISSTGLTGSQITSTGTLSGIKTIPGDYTNLTTAFAAINTNGLAGNIELQLASGYPGVAEPTTITTSNAIATGAYTVKVYPTVSGLSITGSFTGGLINFNNGTNITIDGRVNQTGAKSLVISNTNTGTGAYALQFINDAIGNTVKYCTVKSLNPLATSGVIVFSTTTGTTGNDNNTIDNCDIDGGAGATASPTSVAQNGVYASGTVTTAAQNNSGNTISNCNIFNNFVTGAAATSAAVLILTGNTDWTITGNSIYQTNTRTSTVGAATVYGISIANASGNNFVVTNNFVGGNTSSAGGTAWTLNGAFANRFQGIGLSVGTTTASSIQGNTVANFSFGTTSSASANSTSTPLGTGGWGGIYVGAGSANIGTTSPNTVGSGTGTGSITHTVTTNAGGTANGIGCSGSGVINISNNIIGSMNALGATAAVSTGITGINSNATGTVTINNNTIGSTATANSINASLASTGSTAQVVTGIVNTGAATAISITNNNGS